VNLSEPFIKRPVMTMVLTVSAILFGIMAYRSLPVDALPPVDYPVIQVTCGYPGANPETVAANIATPLERQFMQIPGLELVTSKSTQGFCNMTLQFVLTKSVDAAATDVQAAISRATGSLPIDLPSPPTFQKTNPNDQPIQYIAVTSDTMTRGQLYDLASTQLQQRISIVSGVSRVDVYGSKSAIRVKADPDALAARRLSIDDLNNAIREATSYQGAGQFDGATRTFLLRPQGQLETAEQYNNLIIARQNGAPVYLRDIARAEESLQDERVDMRFWVRGRHVPKATVVLAVSRQAGANAIQVAQSVRELLPKIQQQMPASVGIILVYDRSRSIVDSVKDVQETLFIAFILVVVVIFMFLGRATDTLIPAVALPLSLLLTIMVMSWLGFSIDNLSLMALTLAIGFLVDDAIVFLENTVRRMETYGETPLRATINSAQEISFTILSMTLSLASVFLPLVFMGGQIGRIFREFAVTTIVAILASGVVSLTLTPLMCARMLSARGHGAKKTWVERIIGAVEKRVLGVYGNSLWFFLRHRWISLIVWCVCLCGTGYLLYIVPKAFLPVGDSSFAFGIMVGPQGTSPEQMRIYQTRAEDVIHANESVEMSFTMTGNSQFIGANQGFLIAFLKDPKDRPPLTMYGPDGKQHTIEHPSIQQVSGALAMNLAMKLQGAIGFFTPQPVLEVSTGATGRTGGQFSYAISGVDAQEVYKAAAALQMRMMSKVGTMFPTPPFSGDMDLATPSLKIDILRDQAKMYNVSPTSVLTLLRNAYSQNYVYLIKKADDQYQVILESSNETRRSPDDLNRLYVNSDDGTGLIPLRAVAKWDETVGAASVSHLNQFPSVTFNFNLIPGVPVGDAVNFIEAQAKEVVPSTLRGEFQGEALAFRQTMSSLSILMIIAVFVMYVILAILYESYLHPITVLSTLPTALVGGLLTLVLFGEEASLYAFIGLFMLMGIVKKNGIMIVDFAIQRVADGQSAEDSIHEASMDRFRPILMTTLAAIMGAVPIAMGWGTGGGTRRPLGLVIVGGLIVSQLITLYVTPVIYLYMELFQEKVLNRIPFFAAHYEGHHHQHEATGEARVGEEVEVPAGANGNGDER
jgi:HAE1 family hydrophobic/amphiphilic exporter-1